MPRVPDNARLCAVYLFANRFDATSGEDDGGSGFVLSMAPEGSEGNIHLNDYLHLYVVTNKHVVTEGYRVIRYTTVENTSDYIETIPEDWDFDLHNDLAVYLLPHQLPEGSPDPAVTAIDITFLMTEEEVRQHDIGPGDEVFFIGRFIGHGGKRLNTPSVRFGTISMMPNEQEPVEYGAQRQVSFLLEARSRSGYSGSPMFWFSKRIVNRRSININLESRLLGIDWAHLPEKVELCDPRGYLHGKRWYVEVHSGMMCAVPAWKLRAFLFSAQVTERRKQAERAYIEKCLNTAHARPET